MAPARRRRAAETATVAETSTQQPEPPAWPVRYTLLSTSNPPFSIPPIEHPLTVTGRRALTLLLSQSCPTGALKRHLDQATEKLIEAARDMNDSLCSLEEREQNRNAKLKELVRKHSDNEEQLKLCEQRLEESNAKLQGLAEYRTKVDNLTDRMDGGMQEMSDSYHMIDYIREAHNAAMAASMRMAPQRGPRVGSDGESDSESGTNNTPRLSGVPSSFAAASATPVYQSMLGQDSQTAEMANRWGLTPATVQPSVEMAKKLDELVERDRSRGKEVLYGEQEQYVTFRQMVHDARNPEDENGTSVPLPPKRMWFTPAGRSTLVYPARADEMGTQENGASQMGGTGAGPDGGVGGGGGGGADDDESDLEIEVQAVKTSMKCPITMQPLQNPLTNRECGHNYEKDAIYDLLSHNARTVRCPATNCPKFVTKSTLYTDPVLIRRLERRREREAAEEEDEDATMGDGPGGGAGAGAGDGWAYL